MRGWIIYNGQLNSDKILELVYWLKDTAKEYNIDLLAVKNNELMMIFNETCQPLIKHQHNEPLPDFVISWDKDIPLARHFEKMNIKVYNTSEGVLACDDKIKTYEFLANHNIPMPKTVIAPMVYSNSHITDLSLYDKIIDYLKLPLIIKEAFGSFGQQVYMVSSKDELLKTVQNIGSSPHLFQEYIQNSHGQDVRLNIVDNKVVAAMKRISTDDFRANITNGGKAILYDPTQEEIDLALKCHQLLKLDFSGVDLLFGENGPLLCEVNGNPHFKSIFECTSIDVSRFIIEYIIKDLK